MRHSPHLKWISHRGNRQDFDENTVAAFESATLNGYRHLETDLRLSADHQMVHWHDEHLMDRGGKLHKIRELKRSELERIVLPRGSHLMFFDQFCDRFGGFGWTLDVKPESAKEVLKGLQLLNRTSHWMKTVPDLRLILWSKKDIAEANRTAFPFVRYASKDECIRAGLAVISRVPAIGNICPDLIYSLPARFMGIDLFRRSFVDAFHLRKARVIAFLPSTLEQVNAVKSSGFDEILSDFPSPI